MIDAVIFDLDGLLVDSEPVWFRVRTEIFSRYGLPWTEDDQKALMGRNTQAWIDYGVEKLGGRLGPDIYREEVLHGMVSAYRAGQVQLMPGAREAIEFCAVRVPLGLASGSPPVLIDAALEANGWSGVFREKLSSDQVPHGKPAPDSYLEVLRRLSVPPANAVVVEDSGSGILAGKAAGAYVVAVPNPALMPPPEAMRAADVVLESLHLLPEHLADSLRRRDG
jgi:HAD superfamily hydrolase (TIGR01509 family)